MELAKLSKEEAVQLGIKAEIKRMEIETIEEIADRAEMSRQLLRYYVNRQLETLGLRKKRGTRQSPRTHASGTEEAHPDGTRKSNESTSRRSGPSRRASAQRGTQ